MSESDEEHRQRIERQNRTLEAMKREAEAFHAKFETSPIEDPTVRPIPRPDDLPADLLNWLAGCRRRGMTFGYVLDSAGRASLHLGPISRMNHEETRDFVRKTQRMLQHIQTHRESSHG